MPEDGLFSAVINGSIIMHDDGWSTMMCQGWSPPEHGLFDACRPVAECPTSCRSGSLATTSNGHAVQAWSLRRAHCDQPVYHSPWHPHNNDHLLLGKSNSV